MREAGEAERVRARLGRAFSTPRWGKTRSGGGREPLQAVEQGIFREGVTGSVRSNREAG